jgi:hypothetical protein
LSKQSVTVALNGYVPQTLAVDVRDAKDFNPNPVQVTLQAVHPKSHMPKSAKTATSSGEPLYEQQRAQAPAAGDAEQAAAKANWCLTYSDDGGGRNCGFETYQQCKATAAGGNGSCSPSPYSHWFRRHYKIHPRLIFGGAISPLIFAPVSYENIAELWIAAALFGFHGIGMRRQSWTWSAMVMQSLFWASCSFG